MRTSWSGDWLIIVCCGHGLWLAYVTERYITWHICTVLQLSYPSSHFDFIVTIRNIIPIMQVIRPVHINRCGYVFCSPSTQKTEEGKWWLSLSSVVRCPSNRQAYITVRQTFSEQCFLFMCSVCWLFISLQKFWATVIGCVLLFFLCLKCVIMVTESQLFLNIILMGTLTFSFWFFIFEDSLKIHWKRKLNNANLE